MKPRLSGGGRGYLHLSVTRRNREKRKRVTPHPYETRVAQYLQRFREHKPNAKNEHGGGAQKEPDMAIMQALRDGLRLDDMDEACESLRSFIIGYGVNRTFKGMGAGARVFEPVVRHLRARRAVQMQLSTPEAIMTEVGDLAGACKAAGFNHNVSFASKCLCMLGAHVPILSSECVAYLGLKEGTKYTAEYVDAWTAEYERHRAGYEAAAERLMGATERERGLSATWVAMRGLDQHMVVVGAPMRKKAS